MPLRVLAFDVFGTLVDWRGSIAEEVRGLVADPEAFADAWRGRYQPSMDRVRTGAIPWTNLDTLHRASLDEVLAEFGRADLGEAERSALNLAWHRLRPWPETREGLARLRTRYTLTPLSNGNFALLTELAKSAGLGFDCILSAELARAYKPDPRAYRLVPDLLAVEPGEAMLVAAHSDDLRAAASQGLRTAFVARPLEWGPGRGAETPDPSFDHVAADLLDLAAQLGV